MFHLSQPVFYAVFVAYAPEDVLERAVISASIRELHAIIGQYSVDPIGHRCDQIAQELGLNALARLSNKANEAKFAGSINGDEEIELTPAVWTSAISTWK